MSVIPQPKWRWAWGKWGYQAGLGRRHDNDRLFGFGGQRVRPGGSFVHGYHFWVLRLGFMWIYADHDRFGWK